MENPITIIKEILDSPNFKKLKPLSFTLGIIIGGIFFSTENLKLVLDYVSTNIKVGNILIPRGICLMVLIPLITNLLYPILNFIGDSLKTHGLKLRHEIKNYSLFRILEKIKRDDNILKEKFKAIETWSLSFLKNNKTYTSELISKFELIADSVEKNLRSTNKKDTQGMDLLNNNEKQIRITLSDLDPKLIDLVINLKHIKDALFDNIWVDNTSPRNKTDIIKQNEDIAIDIIKSLHDCNNEITQRKYK